ncbi:hypothetical protein COB72_05025 [bacterium]|nr:MAG: hypothetical protein COB72_05025 [bacterium]
MKRTRKAHSLRAFCGLVVAACSGWSLGASNESADKPTDIMWLVDGTRFKSFVGCGNSGEFSQPPQFGVVINEAGEIIEQRTQETWVRTYSDELLVLSSMLYAGAIPKRTIIKHDYRLEYESDLVPNQIGNGWLICERNRGLSGGMMRDNHMVDRSSTEYDKFFYLNDKLEMITDIQSHLGLRLHGQKLIGFVGPTAIPVVQEPKTRLQRIITKKNKPSKNAFFRIDVEQRNFDHPRFVLATEVGHRWIYDPITDTKVQEVLGIQRWPSNEELIIFGTKEGEPRSIYKEDGTSFRQIATLGFRMAPVFLTSEHFLMCDDRVAGGAAGHRVFKAYQIMLDPDEDTTDRLVEVDVSWVKKIEYKSVGPFYGVRNQSDELVIIDARFEPIMTFDPAYTLQRITNAGNVLIVDSETHVFSYFDAHGELIRDYDVAVLLGE